ncbi:hypothetical protein J3458_000473 [Metarhizium acridum]|uniref:uncharacterized protein n=1 Tax=Metarhizium acridum TaxID=92637 RepID=UPI001C6D1A74|nr:hypothetical protein J3458_000473 [Metarhizium acridum]
MTPYSAKRQSLRLSGLPWKRCLLASTELVHMLAQLKPREAHIRCSALWEKGVRPSSLAQPTGRCQGYIKHEENTKCYLADQRHCGIARCASLYRRLHLAPWVIAWVL